jgi:subtilisin family serine protease
MKRIRFSTLAVLGGLAIGWTVSGRGQPTVTPPEPRHLPDELIVQFRPGAADAQLLDALNRGGLRPHRAIQTRVMRAQGHPGLNLMKTRLPVLEAARLLQGHPAVEYAEPNWVYTHQETSNDPYYTGGSLWGMYGDLSSPANQYGSQAAEAWTAGDTGSGDVVIGVIDEGIQVTHPDLAANIWVNPGETAGNGIDDDGNGFVDDVNGWDFYEDNDSVYDGTGDDHATHVAGTIGAVGGNELGVAGVNWHVSVISVKFLGPNGGTTSDAVRAIDYLVDLKVNRGVNLVAINASWGGGGYSQAMLDALVRAAQANILFVAAAGNGDWLGRAVNTDSRAYYPACYNTAAGAGYDAVLSVTAIDRYGNKASWANYGALTVDLGAPGVEVYSTLPVDSYGSYSGTSMATPHVTGAIALYASTHPGAPAAEIRQAILDAALPTSSLSGRTVTGGRLDLSEVISPPPATPPAAPSGLVAEAVSYNQIDLSWTDNSTDEDGFTIERSIDGTTFAEIATVGPDVTSFSNSGLSASTTYYYRVRAFHSGGASAYSNEASATTLAQPTIPAAPSGLAATAKSRTRIDLAWTDNSGNETGFRIYRSRNQTSWTQIATVGANVTTYSNTGLSRNTTYYYRVRAYNAQGNSPYSNIASAKTYP